MTRRARIVVAFLRLACFIVLGRILGIWLKANGWL